MILESLQTVRDATGLQVLNFSLKRVVKRLWIT